MSGFTALILGAGASLNYGLPLGSGLVEKICQLLPSAYSSYMGDEANSLHNFLASDRESVLAWSKVSKKELSYSLIEFQQRLIESAPKSIDEFLSRDFGNANPVFRRIGKLAATYIAKAGTLLDPAAVNKWASTGFKEVESSFDITHPYGTLGSLTAIEYGSQNNFRFHGAAV